MGEKSIQFSVSEELKKEIDTYAQKKGLKTAAFVRSVLFDYMRNEPELKETVEKLLTK